MLSNSCGCRQVASSAFQALPDQTPIARQVLNAFNHMPHWLSTQGKCTALGGGGGGGLIEPIALSELPSLT